MGDPSTLERIDLGDGRQVWVQTSGCASPASNWPAPMTPTACSAPWR